MRKICKVCAALSAAFFITIIITEQMAFARIGGGRSFGGRGSRSYSRPYSSPRQSQQPNTSPNYSQPGGGMLRGLGAGLAGGFIGSMLFRGMGYGSTGVGGGGGIGLLEIILIGGLGYMVYRMYKRRKEGSGSSFLQNARGLFGGNMDSPNKAEGDLSDIKMSDPSFTEGSFKDNVMDIFFKLQAAWMNRDLSPAKSLLTEEMKSIIQEDIDSLLESKKINRLENIAVRSVEVAEAWQESGQDYITALIYANILDYTVDEESGDVINGSKTEPTKFEEYWTFTRTSRSNKWLLSAISQA